jgi:FPC/CPF motif-containing protein YcgG
MMAARADGLAADEVRDRVLAGVGTGTVDAIPGWFPASVAAMRQQLLAAGYPCYLGTVAERRGDVKYTCVEGGEWGHLPGTLARFLTQAGSATGRRLVLAAIFEPEKEERPHAYYEERFWALLQFLHENDPVPWPADYPTDPDDPRWEFVLAGVPVFTFLAAPSYRARKSRNLGPSQVVLFQPRTVFDGIEGETRAGIRSRQRIRKLLAEWDGLLPHPDLKSYGDPSNREWKQYVLPEANSPVEGRCPLRIRPGTNRTEAG